MSNTDTQKQSEIFAGAMSIAEINQLKGYCAKLTAQNQDLQSELNKYKQDLEEIAAGILMLAQFCDITVPKDAENSDLISEIAAYIENQKDYITEMEEK